MFQRNCIYFISVMFCDGVYSTSRSEKIDRVQFCSVLFSSVQFSSVLFSSVPI